MTRFDFRTRLGYASTVSQKSESTNLGVPRVCSIADALEVVGERWSLLVLRELGFGVHRFKDIQINTGAPRETLALRLHKLEEAGVIERRRYCDRPPRDEYLPTAAGRELLPVLAALREWGERHVTPARQAHAYAGTQTPSASASPSAEGPREQHFRTAGES